MRLNNNKTLTPKATSTKQIPRNKKQINFELILYSVFDVKNKSKYNLDTNSLEIVVRILTNKLF